jgi:hypothetical protein
MPVSVTDIVDAPKAKRAEYLQVASYTGTTPFGALLFCYAAHYFREHSSKGRALYIWETFLKKVFVDAAGNAAIIDMGAMDELDLTVPEIKRTTWDTIKDWVAMCAALKLKAAQMSKLERFFSSADRNIPATIFDKAVNDLKTIVGYTNPFSEVAGGVGTLKAHRSEVGTKQMKAHLPTLLRDLKAAGFSLDDIGMTNIK